MDVISKTDPVYKDFCRYSKVFLIFQTYISHTNIRRDLQCRWVCKFKASLYIDVCVRMRWLTDFQFCVFYVGDFITFGQHLLIHFCFEKCSGNSPFDTWTVWRDVIHTELVKKLTVWPVNHWYLWQRRKILSQKSFETRNLASKCGFLPCFKLKQLAKKRKLLQWPLLGIKLTHLEGQEGFSYWGTFAVSAEMVGTMKRVCPERTCLQKPEWTTLYKAELLWVYCETNLGLQMQRLIDLKSCCHSL